ncbi:MAG: D-glucuronyl C5-epimerase family protein [Halobacteriota archaeon]|nr:D-glucuronyl C5-epimerase family protein [Halobacteriota archaeon]
MQFNIKKHLAIILVAILLTFPVANFSGDLVLSFITVSIVNTRNILDPSKSIGEGILLDESGVPLYDYGYNGDVYIGIQRNPVTISQQAFYYWDEFQKGDERSKKLFLNCSDWLVDNAVFYGNYSVWEYNFPWPDRNLTPPWISGMAQGQGIQVLARAYNITSDQKYLEVANSSLQVFYIEVKNGGVTYKDPETGGWWYEEYPNPDPSEDRVLNGFIFALLGIHEYYERTGDEDAKYLFDKGIIELKNNLPNYDTGEWTYYDQIGNNASISYHHLHVRQLEQLYEITQDPVFEQYYQKWKSYEDDPLLRYEQMNKKEKAVYPFTLFAIFVFFEMILFVYNRYKIKS